MDTNMEIDGQDDHTNHDYHVGHDDLDAENLGDDDGDDDDDYDDDDDEGDDEGDDDELDDDDDEDEDDEQDDDENEDGEGAPGDPSTRLLPTNTVPATITNGVVASGSPRPSARSSSGSAPHPIRLPGSLSSLKSAPSPASSASVSSLPSNIDTAALEAELTRLRTLIAKNLCGHPPVETARSMCADAEKSVDLQFGQVHLQSKKVDLQFKVVDEAIKEKASMRKLYVRSMSAYASQNQTDRGRENGEIAKQELLQRDLQSAEAKLQSAQENLQSAQEILQSAQRNLQSAQGNLQSAEEKLQNARMNVDVVFQTESAKLEKQIQRLEKRLGMASTSSSGSTGRDTNRQKKLKRALIQRDKQCVVLKHHSERCHAAHIVPVADCNAGRISVDACYDVTNGILLSSSLRDWFDHHTFSIQESNDLNSGRIFHIRVAPLFADELRTVSVTDGMQITFGGPSDKWPLREHLLNHFQKFQLAHQPRATADPPRPPRHQDSDSTLGHDGDLEDTLDPLLRELPLKQAMTDQPKDNMMAGAPISATWIDLWVTDIVERMLAAGVQIG